MRLSEGRRVALKEICEVEKGQSITSKKISPGNIPVIAGGKQPAYYHSRANYHGKTITVSASGAYAGFVNYFEVPIFASDCSVIKPKGEDVSLKYVYYALKAQQKTIYRLQRGAGQPHVYPSDLKEIKVVLRSLTAQDEIVETLDMIEETKGLRVQADELTSSLLKAVFYEMFGNPVKNPLKWDLANLADLGELARGKSKHRPRNDPKLLGGKYPLIQTGDVTNSGGYITKFTQSYSELGLRQSKMWPKGTLCITIAANIARTGILTFDACFPDSVVGFTPNERTTTEYVQHWMSFIQKRLEDSAPESAQKNINLEILEKLEVPVPPIDLQRQFSKIVEKTQLIRTFQNQSRFHLDNLFNTLVQASFGVN